MTGPPDATRGPGQGPADAQQIADSPSLAVVPATRPARRFEWEKAVRETPILESSTKLVCLLVGTYMNADGTGARPSIATLASNAVMKPRAVRGHVTKAIGAAYLQRITRGHRLGNGKTITSTYRAVLPLAAPTCPLSEPSTGTDMPLDPATSSGTGEHLNRHETAPQAAPQCRLPEPKDQNLTTPPAADDLVRAATLLLARQEVEAEQKAGSTVRNPEAVANYRVANGTHASTIDALRALATRRPDITTPAALLAEHQRPKQRIQCDHCDAGGFILADDGFAYPCPKCRGAA